MSRISFDNAKGARSRRWFEISAAIAATAIFAVGCGGGDTGGTTSGSEKGRKKCNDGLDNDGDGFIDGADSDCR